MFKTGRRNAEQTFFPKVEGPAPARLVTEQSAAENPQSEVDLAKNVPEPYRIPKAPPKIFDPYHQVIVPATTTRYPFNIPSDTFEWIGFYFPTVPAATLSVGPNQAALPILQAGLLIMPVTTDQFLFDNTAATPYTVYIISGRGHKRPEWYPAPAQTGPQTSAQSQSVVIATDQESFEVNIEPPDAAAVMPTNIDSAAYENSHIIKAAPGNLLSLYGYSSLAGAQFIQVFDAIAVPADTAVPKLLFGLAAAGNFNFPLPIYGRAFTTGIVVCNSTTGPTKTIGAANCWFDAEFI